jgi:hypothetical protein
MVKSAARVFELLELFDAERRPLRVTEIVQRLDMPQSSVSMLLKTMVARGYMEFDAADCSYCPSVRISFLNEWAMRAPGQRQDMQDAMRRLAPCSRRPRAACSRCRSTKPPSSTPARASSCSTMPNWRASCRGRSRAGDRCCDA